MKQWMEKRREPGARERKSAYERRTGRLESEVIDVVPAAEIRSIHHKIGLLVTPHAQREFLHRDMEDALEILQDVYYRLSTLLGMRVENPDYDDDDEDW